MSNEQQPAALIAQTSTITESEVRTMRDQVYRQQSSDHNWEFCKDAWMKPECVEWLRQQTSGATYEETNKEEIQHCQ